MADLTQTISNLVGILLGVVGAVGVGFFIYGAYLYLTASGAPHQMERGKSAMMTALAGIVLAMVAYGVVELVMNAVVGSPGGDRPAGPDHAHTHTRQRVDGLSEGSKEERHERTRGADPRAGRGQGAAGVHLPAGRGDDGGVRPVLRRIPLRPRRAVRGEDGHGRPPGPGGAGRRRREDRRSAAAHGGRRPAEVPAWGEALRRAAVRAGAERAARAGAAGEERPRPPAADGEAGGQDPAPPSPEAREPGENGRADALPPPPLVRQAQEDGG